MKLEQPGFMIDYEKKAEQDEAKTTIMYGVIWCFLGLLISIMAYLQDHHWAYYGLSAILLIVGITKLVKGISFLRK